MIRVHVRHHVKDFAVWQRIYEGFDERKIVGRVQAWGIYQGVDDPNDVTVFEDFEDLETARAYVEAPSVADAMRSAGVDSEPQVWFTTEAGSWSSAGK